MISACEASTSSPTAGEISPSLLEVFERCFSDEVCLGFQYEDRKGRTTQRRVAPHGLFVESPVWYILAVDIDKDAQRMFRMDRISSPRPTGQPFDPSREVVEQMMERDDDWGWFADAPEGP